LSPSKSHSDGQDPEEPEASPPAPSQSKWTLSNEALYRLLDCFSPDRDEALQKYQLQRAKLHRTFERRFPTKADELVDDAMDRVTRRIDEGQKISNLNAYLYEVAQIIIKETLRKVGRFAVPLDDMPEPPAPDPPEDDAKELRLQCLDSCLELLPVESRYLILSYYQYEQGTKIDLRKQLAYSLGISKNALGIRACRLRISLENCIRDCLSQTVESK
jgi:DNA-directed RNA polymerase specialized sigma24 family protein